MVTIGLTIVFFVLCGIGLALYAGLLIAPLKPSGTPTNTQAANTNTASPTVFARTLDGVLVGKQGEAAPFPLGIIIENLPETRPQYGLSLVSVVYETLVEGGATRFLAVFPGAPEGATKIGPVRSLRSYYAEWVSEYHAAIAHAGGSPDALRMVIAFTMKDVNAIGHEAMYFVRDHAFAAPHNLFSSGALLSALLRDKGWTKATAFTPWTFKDDMPLEARPADDQYVRVKFSGVAFETEFRYRRATNTYARFNAGKPHTDALTGEQLQVKNVVVQIVPKVLAIGEKGRLTLDVHGTGKALIFVDGGMNVGTWRKADRTGRTEFFFEDGSPAQLNRGQTWVEVVPEDKTVEYGTPAAS